MGKCLRTVMRLNLVILYFIENAFGLHTVRSDRVGVKLRCKWFIITVAKWSWPLAILALGSSSYAFSVLFYKGLVFGVEQKYLKQSISLVIVWLLNLFVALVVYMRQLVDGDKIDELNKDFEKLVEQYSGSSVIEFQRLKGLVLLLTYEAATLVVLWLNINPTYRFYSGHDWFLSVAVMAPITIRSLLVTRYCVNFSSVGRIVRELNRELSIRVRRFHRMQAKPNISFHTLTNIELKLTDHLDGLIIQYDRMHDVVMAIIEIYSPSILFVLVLDFGQMTFEMYMLYCDLAHTSLDSDDLHTVIFSLVSAVLSFLEIAFVVDGTSKYTVGLEESIEWLQRIGIHCIDGRLAKSVATLSQLCNRAHGDVISFYYFALDRSFLMTIIAASCSYLILLIQTV
ncbi:uncharacterized protein LOC129771223 [Toxorhynchites rutilus septentrionalis]|uniref:uncharacterized protein LOC129771223 n=1 Tax=Toxorhynchites rutilus septentrionalis TaxID=329112 RepID=UPI0024796593|nr:uncharacterized protein LOC129771223 [Toxorhynchites rutilus septentrionalis]